MPRAGAVYVRSAPAGTNGVAERTVPRHLQFQGARGASITVDALKTAPFTARDMKRRSNTVT